MVNILIPTDFSQASFRLAEQAVKTLDKEANIILFHMYEMPNGISDLIRKDPPYAEMMNDSFRQNCKYLKYKYPNHIKKICFKYLTGNTQAIFNNFTEANEIDMIVCPEHYVFTKKNRASINPAPFFKKSKIAKLTHFATESKPAKEQVTEPANLSIAGVALASA